MIGILIGWVLRGDAYVIAAAEEEGMGNFTVDTFLGTDNEEFNPDAVEDIAQKNYNRYDIEILAGNPFFGETDAPILFVEYSDYFCPFCSSFVTETAPLILEKYGDQIRYVFKNLPLTDIHPGAINAAESAHCAGEQGSFWEFHDLLFQAEQEDLDADFYIATAESLNLNLFDFQNCINDGTYKDLIKRDLDFGFTFGLRSTPSFFINGIPVIGAQPFEVFESVIDSELERLADVVP